MGFRFRKSLKFGPFRINLSKSGVGYSFGGKGFRVTKSATGKTYATGSIPGTGISVQQNLSKDQSKTKEAAPVPVKPSVSPEPVFPYEHIKFYLEDTQLVNENKVKRQDVLYRYKMRRPPFDQKIAEISIVSDSDFPEIIEIAINGDIVGKVPKKNVEYINDRWDRVDCVSALEVAGRRGTYDAVVHLRFFKPGMEPQKES